MKEITSSSQGQKIWNFCSVLRDDGMSYGDYLEQITYLLFLKIAHEYSSHAFYGKTSVIPKEYTWDTFVSKTGDELDRHYKAALEVLGKERGLLGSIFIKSQNKIQNPAILSRLVSLINEDNWASLGTDIKGDIYEYILEKNAQDTKSGAGQYFTPRALIQVIVECIRPEPMRTICDPACGTGGFLLAAYAYLSEQDLDKDERKFLKNDTFSGNEIVPSTRRLALMNLFLHNIGEIGSDKEVISKNDALLADTGQRVDYVLANPPFGKKSSIKIVHADGKEDKEEMVYNRQDFWTTTTNKQLNFLQHIKTLLKTTGKAAVVLPDNVLFEGGVGEEIRKKLMETHDLHTILRLPTGIFYAQGVKANVLFFDARPAAKEAQTKNVWIYDYRTNIRHTLKEKPLQKTDLADFVACYCPENRHKRKETYHAETNPEGRWRKFSYEEIVARDKTSLDIFWLKDTDLVDLDNLPDPEELTAEIIAEIYEALEGLRSLV